MAQRSQRREARESALGHAVGRMQFLVKATARTALRVPNLQRFTIGSAVVDVTNWQSVDPAGPYHRGLFFDVRVEAEEHDAALTAARPVLEQIEGALAFATASGMSHSAPVIAYAEEGEGTRALQHDQLPVVAATRRHLDRDRFRMFWDALQACDPDRRDRVDRAMAWYRKGMFEEFVLDQFQSWWNGLEALNPRLQQKHGLPTQGPPRPCPHCKRPVPGGPIASGIQFAVERVSDPDTWTQIHSARNDIAHARRPLGGSIARIQPVLDVVGRALRDAVLDLLDIPADARAGFASTPLSIPREYEARLDYRLPEVSYADLRSGQAFPHLQGTALDASREEIAGRMQRVSPTYGSTGTQVDEISVTVIARSDPDDPAATMALEGPRAINAGESTSSPQ